MSIASKIIKARPEFRVQVLDSGFVFVVEGWNSSDEYVAYTSVAESMADLNALITELQALPKG